MLRAAVLLALVGTAARAGLPPSDLLIPPPVVGAPDPLCGAHEGASPCITPAASNWANSTRSSPSPPTNPSGAGPRRLQLGGNAEQVSRIALLGLLVNVTDRHGVLSGWTDNLALPGPCGEGWDDWWSGWAFVQCSGLGGGATQLYLSAAHGLEGTLSDHSLLALRHSGMEHVRWAPQLRVGSNDTGVPTVEPLAAWIQAARRVNFNGG